MEEDTFRHDATDRRGGRPVLHASAGGELAPERRRPVLGALRTLVMIRVERVTTWVPTGER